MGSTPIGSTTTFMTEIIVIAALSNNRVIGNKKDIPWYLSDDLVHFKKLTMNYPCIMGRNTFEAIPEQFRPLPNRENIILTSRPEYNPKGTTIFNSFESAIAYAKDYNDKIFIIGGSSVYELGLTVADRLELTRIHVEFDGDTYFPHVNWSEWELINLECDEGTDKLTANILPYSFMSYIRK